MGKPVVVYTRPRDWHIGGYTSDKLDLVYVPISGDNPIRWTGRPAGDGIADLITPTGMKLFWAALNERKPDVILHWIHRKMTASIMEKVRKICPKAIVLVGDGNQPAGISAYVNKMKSFVDGILLNSKDEDTIKKYVDFGFDRKLVRTLCDGFTPSHHDPKWDKEPKYDCFFAGSNLVLDDGSWKFPGGPFRFRFIARVQNDFNLLLHGPQNEWPFKPQPVLYWPRFFPEFQRAKITLGCNHYDLTRYYTRRLVHSGASGRLLITKYIPGMEKDFKNHKHLVWFKGINEGIDQIAYYLREKDKRIEAGKRMREYFVRHHSWEARLREFEDIVLSIV